MIAKGAMCMAAVLGAFIRYLLTFIFFVAVAAAGIFSGKALRKKKMNDNQKDA